MLATFNDFVINCDKISELSDARGGRHQEAEDEGADLGPRQSGGRLEKAAEEEEAHEVAQGDCQFGNSIVIFTTRGLCPLYELMMIGLQSARARSIQSKH